MIEKTREAIRWPCK